MSRHSKNNATQMWFSHHERLKLGLGTQKQRLGADSLRKFDMCCLCLNDAVRPVCTPHGTLYCKHCLLENLAAQKKAITRKMAAYEQSVAELEAEVAEKTRIVQEREIRRFEAVEGSVSTPTILTSAAAEDETETKRRFADTVDARQQQLLDELTRLNAVLSAQHQRPEAHRELKSFWVPSLGPDAQRRLAKRPSDELFDPETHKPLRFKDVLEISFDVEKASEGGGAGSSSSSSRKIEAADDDDDDSSLRRTGTYVCGCCGDAYTSALSAVVLRRCQHAVCVKCYDSIVQREKRCPKCTKKITSIDRDVIRLASGGTGFAAHDSKKLEAVKYEGQMGFA